MKNLNRKYIVWGIRIVISILFIVSAIAKLYPSPLMGISSFETKYLSAIGIDGSFSVILSRLLIGFEFTLGLLILLPYYLKRIVIPSTIALLSAFSIHLFIQVVGGDSSNCGCFGELIPMTPIQALTKNILSIGVLSLLLTSFKHEINDQKNIHPILYSGLIISLLMFILLPQGSSNISRAQVKSGDSIYAQYFPNVAEGNKLVCFFAPTCPHCLETAKQLVALKQKFPGFKCTETDLMNKLGAKWKNRRCIFHHEDGISISTIRYRDNDEWGTITILPTSELKQDQQQDTESFKKDL